MSDEKIRLETYKYIVNNKTFVYDNCYVENNKFYLDVEFEKEKKKLNILLKIILKT